MPTRLVLNPETGEYEEVTESSVAIASRLQQSASVNPVPLYIENTKLGMWLINNNLYDLAVAKINSVADLIERRKLLFAWNRETFISRHNAQFCWIFQELGKTSNEVDQIFREVAAM